MVIPDHEFPTVMKEQIEPYLADRRQVHYPERETGRPLYCAFYTSDVQAKGIFLIAHGYTETAEKYLEVIYYFLQLGYHVCAIDQCGHGRSYRLVENDLSLVHVDRFERYVKDLHFAALLARRTWPGLPLYLYGHSMGGGIGAALTACAPDLFEKVILNAPMIRPLTGGVPWPITKGIVDLSCLAGRNKDYVITNHPFVPHAETFETCAASCQERFTYYQEKRENNPLFQMNGASNEWLRQAGRLEKYLQKEAPGNIKVPVLLFQATDDHYVSGDAEDHFANAVNRFQDNQKEPRVQIHKVPSKHEIFNAGADVLEGYWEEIRKFLD